jgi:hypothetical protein
MDTKKKKRTTDYTDITDGFSHEDQDCCVRQVLADATHVSIPNAHF